MSISSISSISNNSYVSEASNDVSQLQTQKASLQKQLQQVNESKDDAKTKAAKIKELETEIQQIDIEIQQKQAMKTSKVSKNQEESLKNIDNKSNVNPNSIVGSNEESNDNIIDDYA